VEPGSLAHEAPKLFPLPWHSAVPARLPNARGLGPFELVASG
jgi:hypothetical protein